MNWISQPSTRKQAVNEDITLVGVMLLDIRKKGVKLNENPPMKEAFHLKWWDKEE